jgi:hypothetical protein
VAIIISGSPDPAQAAVRTPSVVDAAELPLDLRTRLTIFAVAAGLFTVQSAWMLALTYSVLWLLNVL